MNLKFLTKIIFIFNYLKILIEFLDWRIESNIVIIITIFFAQQTKLYLWLILAWIGWDMSKKVLGGNLPLYF